MAPVALYAMVGSCILATKSTRASLPSLIPLIGRQRGLAEAETALLMSSFYPGVSEYSYDGATHC
jgi:hypothetical protein|eukprot:COSAG06_NODE_44_length_29699_cov_231.744527_24_plen_65_part_00